VDEDQLFFTDDLGRRSSRVNWERALSLAAVIAASFGAWLLIGWGATLFFRWLQE
jgi:hypothetical protein